MKIERLSFKNINSLKGEHHVNFDEAPLNSGGLFAIIGPTGSGKSTLLDAICLALYGRTPRISSVNKNKIEQDGSILTKYQKEAYAKVKFSCNAGTFVSTWSISTNRNGNLREYDMDLWNPSDESSYSEKKTEVLEEIQRLIGLSYDQFVKSVLLSQGEFATLLQSNEKERSELLEKITNTSIYRQIGIKVYEKYSGLKSKIQEQKLRLEDLEKKLLDQEILKEKNAEKKILDQEVQQKQIKLSQFSKEWDQLKAKEKLEAELVIEKNKLESLAVKHKEFDQRNAKTLDLHSKTLAFEEELQEFNVLAEKQEHQAKTLKELEEEQHQLESKIKGLKDKIQELLKATIEDAKVEIELDTLLKRYQKLENERLLKLNDYKSKQQLLIKELRVIGTTSTNPSISDFKTELEDQLKLSKQNIESFDIQLKNGYTLEESISAQRQFLNQIKEAKYEDKSIKELNEKVLKLQKQVSTEKEELSTFPELLSKKEVGLESTEKEVAYLETQKDNQNLKLQVEDLRKKLKTNEACPVCGSTSHPFAEHAPEVDSELEKKLKEQKHQLQLISKEIEVLKARQTSKKERVEELETELKDTRLNFEKKKEHFTKTYKEVLSELQEDKLEELEKSVEQHIQHLEKTKQLQLEIEALENAIGILDDLLEIKSKGSELRSELESIYEGQNLDKLVSDLKSSWITVKSNLTSTQKSIGREKNDLKIIENRLQNLQANLEPKIKASEFSSISEANSSRMKASDYQALSQERQELSERLQIQKEKIKGISAQIESFKTEHFKTSEEAVENISELEEVLEIQKNKLEEVNRLLKNHDEDLKRFKTIEESIAEEQKANKKWELLNKLIGGATGTEFNKFAQDLSLQGLILLGNQRLKELNDRYELDRYIKGEDKNQLYVIDHHMGGERRSVKTLSGGETFLISLAMALGLSDLASKNVEINSLFIDEGFGTLDPETLDLTLDTLERLQAESNKTIGIISHVGALKERIQTQIVLDRNAQGYSSLKVVG